MFPGGSTAPWVILATIAARAAPVGAPARLTMDPHLEQIRRHLTVAVRRSCPRWLADQAEDLVQNALVKLLEQRRFGGGMESYPASYLQRVAYSVVIDEVRRRLRKKEVPAAEASDPGGPAELGLAPSSGLGAGDIRAAMIDCLRALTGFRRVAVACRLQGYRVPEIAAFTGWTRKKAEHLVGRGLEDLRRCLESKGVRP